MITTTPETAKFFAPLNLKHTDKLHISTVGEGDELILHVTSDEGAYTSYDAVHVFPQRLIEAKRLGPTQWQVPVTDFIVELIFLWPAEQIVFEDDETKTIVMTMLLTSRTRDSVSQINARYKINGEVPAHDYDLNEDYPLAPYQQVALCGAMSTPGYSLFMEQGTGKTAVIVALISNLAKKQFAEASTPYRAIIVAPNNVRLNWQREIEKFSTVPTRVTVIRGGEVQRISQLTKAFAPGDHQATVIVVGYDTLPNSWNFLKLIPWDLGVLDESQYIKSHRTRRFKFAQMLRDSCTRRVVLTGTPIANTVMDLYTQLEFTDKCGSGFSSFEAFRTFFGSYDVNSAGFETLVGVQNVPFLQERLARSSFIVRKKDVLAMLPDKVYDTLEVEMSPKQAEVYKDMATKLVHEIDNELNSDSNKAMIANNALTKLLRLAQITSGFMTLTGYESTEIEGVEIEKEVKEIAYFDPVPKLDALVELLKEKGPNDKTIVWACFVPDIKAIAARLKDEGIDAVTFYGQTSFADRAEAERRFNYDPNCKVFIGNPAVGGAGLNLLGFPPERADEYDTNCNHVIYYSQDWSYLKRAQSEDRAHRRGTREPVRITDLNVPSTIDEEIRKRVTQKKDLALELSDIRSILSRIMETL